MGSGFDLMLASDFAIADPDSQLRMVIGATAFLPRYVGLKHAMRLILDDGFTSAEEAAELGLITKVAAPGALEDEVNELVERLAELGRNSHGYIGVIKESINRSIFHGLDDDLRMQLIGQRMSDLFRQHPYEPSDD